MNNARRTIKRGGGAILSRAYDSTDISMDEFRLLFLNLLLTVSSTVADSLMTWVQYLSTPRGREYINTLSRNDVNAVFALLAFIYELSVEYGDDIPQFNELREMLNVPTSWMYATFPYISTFADKTTIEHFITRSLLTHVPQRLMNGADIPNYMRILSRVLIFIVQNVQYYTHITFQRFIDVIIRPSPQHTPQ